MFPIIKNHRQKAASSLPSRQVHWRMDGQGWLFWTLIILYSFCNRTSFLGASDIPNFKIQTQNCFLTISYITNSFTVFTSLVFSHLLMRTHRIQVSVFSTSYQALEKKPLDGREFQHSTWNMISSTGCPVVSTNTISWLFKSLSFISPSTYPFSLNKRS